MSKETPGAHLVPGLRRAVELVEWRRRSWGDSVVPAAIATLDEMLVYLRAEIERGGRPSTIQLMDSTAGNQPQRQDALTDQLRDVMAAARRLGCYDAEDWIRTRLEPMAGTETERARIVAEIVGALTAHAREWDKPTESREVRDVGQGIDYAASWLEARERKRKPKPSNGSKEGT